MSNGILGWVDVATAGVGDAGIINVVADAIALDNKGKSLQGLAEIGRVSPANLIKLPTSTSS